MLCLHLRCPVVTSDLVSQIVPRRSSYRSMVSLDVWKTVGCHVMSLTLVKWLDIDSMSVSIT